MGCAFLFALLLLIGFDIKLLAASAANIGWASTLLASAVSASIGLSLVRRAGFGVLGRLQESMLRGEGGATLSEGGLLLLAGFFLFAPGFITDGLGVLLLIPPIRGFLAGQIANAMGRGIQNGSVQMNIGGRPVRPPGNIVIDTTGEEIPIERAALPELSEE